MNDVSIPPADRLELIANMLLQEVPRDQICIAARITDDDLSVIETTDAFKSVYSRCILEYQEQQENFNKGWDAAEDTALGNLLTALQWNKNPDFNLRVAMIANKAQRRSASPRNKPLSVGDAGARVVVELNATFVERLNQLKVVQQPTAHPVLSQLTDTKSHDLLTPDKVEAILRPGSKVEKTLDLLPDFAEVE